MIDNFALALSHGLIAVAFWLLLRSDLLDQDPAAESPEAAPPPSPDQGTRRA